MASKRHSVNITCFIIICFCNLLLPLLSEANTEHNDYVEVRASGRGNSRAEAMKNATDEALRKNMGTLIMSREEINGDLLTDRVIQVSRGSVRNARIISEKTENGEILLTVIFQIDTQALRDTARNFRMGKGGSIDIVRRLSLERGIKSISSFFGEIELLDFIDAETEDRKIDPDKGEFSVLVRILFNREKYIRQLASPLASILDDVLVSSDIFTELEDKSPTEKYNAIIYILGENRTFKGWTLPQAFFEAMKNASFLEGFDGKTLLKTQKRIWVNIALLDSQGREISLHRIPVPIPITNIIFFSMQNNNFRSPWHIADGNASMASLICAPFFGISSKNGTHYESLYSDRLAPLEQRFVFHLPEETLSKINSALSWLNIEE